MAACDRLRPGQSHDGGKRTGYSWGAGHWQDGLPRLSLCPSKQPYQEAVISVLEIRNHGSEELLRAMYKGEGTALPVLKFWHLPGALGEAGCTAEPPACPHWLPPQRPRSSVLGLSPGPFVPHPQRGSRAKPACIQGWPQSRWHKGSWDSRPDTLGGLLFFPRAVARHENAGQRALCLQWAGGPAVAVLEGHPHGKPKTYSVRKASIFLVGNFAF